MHLKLVDSQGSGGLSRNTEPTSHRRYIGSSLSSAKRARTGASRLIGGVLVICRTHKGCETKSFQSPLMHGPCLVYQLKLYCEPSPTTRHRMTAASACALLYIHACDRQNVCLNDLAL